MALYAFDGTWQSDHTGEKGNSDAAADNSNVVRFRDLYARCPGANVVYEKGVGTMLGVAGKIIGGAFGAGELYRLISAYRRLCEHWVDGDRVIDLVGFSRGAATCLDFTNMIERKGIRDPKSDKLIEPHPTIRFVGLFDTVGAFNVGALLADVPDTNFGHHLKLPSSRVQYCFHAMALDEDRPSFNVIRVAGAHEVWFRGVHSDVGGGNGNTGLNDISLRWMLCKAKAIGVPLADADLTALRPDSACAPHLHEGLDKLKLLWRPVLHTDTRHYAVRPAPAARSIVELVNVEDEKAELIAQMVAAEGLEAEAIPEAKPRLAVL
jgi:hypothetical protein